MADLKMHTEAVDIAAGNLKMINRQIREGFTSVQRSISQLSANWEGSAATNAIRCFNEIQSYYCDARYNVMDKYVNFMLQQVGDGYTQTEDINKSLADAFK